MKQLNIEIIAYSFSWFSRVIATSSSSLFWTKDDFLRLKLPPVKEPPESKLINQLNEAIKYRDNLTEEIKSKRELRMSYVNQNEVLDVELRECRKDLKDIQNEVNSSAIKATKLETILNNHLTRLNDEYRMTENKVIFCTALPGGWTSISIPVSKMFVGSVYFILAFPPPNKL